MNWNQLRYVLTIAEEKSITRAAQRLYLTQPSLSLSLAAQQLPERPPQGYAGAVPHSGAEALWFIKTEPLSFIASQCRRGVYPFYPCGIPRRR